MLSRIAMKRTKKGDAGGVYEIMKNMTLTFAGSSHRKYGNYLLEMICSLELESSPALRTLFLENHLVDASGLPDHFEAGDLFQEQIQDELYEHIGDSDAGFDDTHIKVVL